MFQLLITHNHDCEGYRGRFTASCPRCRQLALSQPIADETGVLDQKRLHILLIRALQAYRAEKESFEKASPAK